jgi:phosphinothricin acetyltransferase
VTGCDSNLWIRSATLADAAVIAAIYNHYVSHSTITFEEVAVDAEEMARRISEVHSKSFPWYVAIEQRVPVGYAYATPWRSRSAYRYAVEVTAYVADGHTGKGIGARLYTELLDKLQNDGFHTAIAGIALPNPASVAMHERLGFEKVAHFKQVGFKRNDWLDVGYWQRLLGPSDQRPQVD